MFLNSPRHGSPVVTCRHLSGRKWGLGRADLAARARVPSGNGWKWSLQGTRMDMGPSKMRLLRDYVLRKSKKLRRFCHKRFSLCCCIWRVGSGKAEAGKLSGAFLHPESPCCSCGLGSEWDVCKWQLETEILPQPRLRWTMSSAIPSPGRLMSMPSQWARQGRLGPNQWQNCWRARIRLQHGCIWLHYISLHLELDFHIVRNCVSALNIAEFPKRCTSFLWPGILVTPELPRLWHLVWQGQPRSVGWCWWKWWK